MSAAFAKSVGVNVSGMAPLLHIAKGFATDKCCGIDKALLGYRLHTARMDESDEKTGNNLRAWRQFRGMSQEDLAARVGTTAAVISLLEAGKRGVSPKWLYRLAPILRTRPGALLDLNPHEIDTDIIEIWSDVPVEQKATARQVLQAFRIKREA